MSGLGNIRDMLVACVRVVTGRQTLDLQGDALACLIP
jgi:hypothetical protein